MQASKEVWGKIFGTINTREKFLDHAARARDARVGAYEGERLARMPELPQRANRWTSPGRARARRPRISDFCSPEKTCIDCHKGIAHHLPDMRDVPGWQ